MRSILLCSRSKNKTKQKKKQRNKIHFIRCSEPPFMPEAAERLNSRLDHNGGRSLGGTWQCNIQQPTEGAEAFMYPLSSPWVFAGKRIAPRHVLNMLARQCEVSFGSESLRGQKKNIYDTTVWHKYQSQLVTYKSGEEPSEASGVFVFFCWRWNFEWHWLWR